MTFDDAEDKTIELATGVERGKVVKEEFALEKWAGDFKKWFLMEYCDSLEHLEERFKAYKGIDKIRKVRRTTFEQVIE